MAAILGAILQVEENNIDGHLNPPQFRILGEFTDMETTTYF